MSPPKSQPKIDDYSRFIIGIILTIIGLGSCSMGTLGVQRRLIDAVCLVAGVALVATTPKFMWRFPVLCASIMGFGGFCIVCGLFVFITGMSGGPASRIVGHAAGIPPLVAGAVMMIIGFVLKLIYSTFHPQT